MFIVQIPTIPFIFVKNLKPCIMKRVVLSDLVYYEVALGGVVHISFSPQELVVKMAQVGMSLN